MLGKKKQVQKHFGAGKILDPKRFKSGKNVMVQNPGQIWPRQMSPGQMSETPWINLFM